MHHGSLAERQAEDVGFWKYERSMKFPGATYGVQNRLPPFFGEWESLWPEQVLQISVGLVGDASESLPPSSNSMARVSGLEASDVF